MEGFTPCELRHAVPKKYKGWSETGDGEGNGTPLQYSCLENPMDGRAWWAAVHGVAKSWTRLSDFTVAFHFHALEKEMATHSSVLAWRIPGIGEPGGLPSKGSPRVRHDWSDLAAAAETGEEYCRPQHSRTTAPPWDSRWDNILQTQSPCSKHRGMRWIHCDWGCSPSSNDSFSSDCKPWSPSFLGK